jgi:hypothetical protein
MSLEQLIDSFPLFRSPKVESYTSNTQLARVYRVTPFYSRLDGDLAELTRYVESVARMMISKFVETEREIRIRLQEIRLDAKMERRTPLDTILRIREMHEAARLRFVAFFSRVIAEVHTCTGIDLTAFAPIIDCPIDIVDADAMIVDCDIDFGPGSEPFGVDHPPSSDPVVDGDSSTSPTPGWCWLNLFEEVERSKLRDVGFACMPGHALKRVVAARRDRVSVRESRSGCLHVESGDEVPVDHFLATLPDGVLVGLDTDDESTFTANPDLATYWIGPALPPPQPDPLTDHLISPALRDLRGRYFEAESFDHQFRVKVRFRVGVYEIAAADFARQRAALVDFPPGPEKIEGLCWLRCFVKTSWAEILSVCPIYPHVSWFVDALRRWPHTNRKLRYDFIGGAVQSVHVEFARDGLTVEQLIHALDDDLRGLAPKL